MTFLRRLRRATTPKRVLVGAVLAVAAVATAADAGDDGQRVGAPPPAVPAGAQPAKVVNVVDGDTINVEPTAPGPLVTTAAHTVRLLLVDTPETVHPSQPVGCYGRDASRYVADQLLGTTVWLEADEQDTDRYGRFLRHVWLDDGTNFNLQLVEKGYADAVRYEPNGRYWARFRDAADDARSRGAGLWGACTAFGVPAAGQDGSAAGLEAERAEGAAPDTGGPATCDPSYPDVCIPPPPPDLDCGSVDARRFAVTGTDPHNFDGNDDGTGCEGG